MHIFVTKGRVSDRIEARQSDSTTVVFEVPHKGPIPHDIVHFHVEQEFGIECGFWGMVANGTDPDEIGALAKAAGHASAKRAEAPRPEFVPIIQVERLVEAFEADLWGGGGDNEMLRSMAASGCEQSLVPPMVLDDRSIQSVRGKLAAFQRHWAAQPMGYTERFEWPEADTK